MSEEELAVIDEDKEQTYPKGEGGDKPFEKKKRGKTSTGETGTTSQYKRHQASCLQRQLNSGFQNKMTQQVLPFLEGQTDGITSITNFSYDHAKVRELASHMGDGGTVEDLRGRKGLLGSNWLLGVDWNETCDHSEIRGWRKKAVVEYTGFNDFISGMGIQKLKLVRNPIEHLVNGLVGDGGPQEKAGLLCSRLWVAWELDGGDGASRRGRRHWSSRWKNMAEGCSGKLSTRTWSFAMKAARGCWAPSDGCVSCWPDRDNRSPVEVLLFTVRGLLLCAEPDRAGGHARRRTRLVGETPLCRRERDEGVISYAADELKPSA
ncbi:arginine/serine-rich splicing factor 35 [Striga asiatica]|uniref:Arginine/serine-rich splicing factor 35 n=1 Tax=Striga asiatica TaxID=4170 RepID=A0A5A7P1Q4_STRAF|nr:arginine/serine-rich splicing factor 35 [Striga asiatica]